MPRRTAQQLQAPRKKNRQTPPSGERVRSWASRPKLFNCMLGWVGDVWAVKQPSRRSAHAARCQPPKRIKECRTTSATPGCSTSIAGLCITRCTGCCASFHVQMHNDRMMGVPQETEFLVAALAHAVHHVQLRRKSQYHTANISSKGISPPAGTCRNAPGSRCGLGHLGLGSCSLAGHSRCQSTTPEGYYPLTYVSKKG